MSKIKTHQERVAAARSQHKARKEIQSLTREAIKLRTGAEKLEGNKWTKAIEKAQKIEKEIKLVKKEAGIK